MPEIVNVVAAGNLGREIDVLAIAEDIDSQLASLSDESYSNRVAYLRREKDGPVATLFRSGSYHITGADSIAETEQRKNWLVEMFENLDIKVNPTFSVKNIVITGDLDESVNLNALAITLGLEKAEYEPEQFPAVIYRLQSPDCVSLIFSSGKVVVTGSPDLEAATKGFETISTRVKQAVR